MNNKMTITSQLSTTEPKNKNELSQQPKQEQIHRNGDHMEGYQWGGGGGRIGGKAQEISITGRHKIGMGKLRIV